MDDFDAFDDDFDMGMLDEEEEDALSGLPEEWYDKYSERWYGRYAAMVLRNDDPMKLGRLIVECPSIYGESLSSPWCEPGMLGADSNQGFVWIPEVGAIVWLDFAEGDEADPEESPLWTYGPWFDDTTGLPEHAQEKTDNSDLSTVTLKGRGAGFIPASTFGTTYPNWRGLKTVSGNMLEFDDTPTKERVQLFHNAGQFLEFTADGSAFLASTKDLKLAALGSFRMATTDSTGAAAGTEIGMSPTGGTYGPKGWLGHPTGSTEPIVCGSVLVAYLNALHGIVAALLGTLIGPPGALDPLVKTAASTAQAAMALLPPIYFTPGPTSFLSDLWYTEKVVTPPEV